MHAILKYLHSPDAIDLRTYLPVDSEDFCLLVQAFIGPGDTDGEESFDFLVCTPQWLTRRLSERDYEFGRHYLFVARYDYAVIEQAIGELCARVDGAEWQTIGTDLARYCHWEFEDYQE